MATYKEIHGTNIEVLSSDPSNPINGQIWYNSSENRVKGFLVNPGSWATGGSLGVATYAMFGVGTQNDAIASGGQSVGGPVDTSQTYDGTSWTAAPAQPSGEGSWYGGAAGIRTSGLSFGGQRPSSPYGLNTMSWNNTSWTNAPDLNTGRIRLGGFGASNTDALAFGGEGTNAGGTPLPGVIAVTESWNGSSWTNGNSMNTARNFIRGSGTVSTAGLAFGGSPGPSGRYTESYNGSWTNLGEILNTSTSNRGASGSQTLAIACGGYEPAITAATESWNGSAWTSVSSLSTARRGVASAGTGNTSALATGGGTPSAVTATEEYNQGPATVTFAS